MADIEAHRRTNDILLGPFERPALKWFAGRMPAWMTPDILTAIGFLGALIIFSGYWLTSYNRNFLWLASLGFVVNWFGDSMDGTLARFRSIQRPRYGFLLDHTVDTFSEVIVFIGLGLSPFIQFNIAMLALTGYLLMSVLVFVRTCVDNEFKISFGRLGPTEVRVIAVLSNTIGFFTARSRIVLPIGIYSVFDIIGIIISVLLFGFFIGSTILQARELASVDKARQD